MPKKGEKDKVEKQDKKLEQSKPYIHIDEYLSSRHDLDENIKFAFKAYLKAIGGIYQRTVDGFEKALEKFFNRKI